MAATSDASSSDATKSTSVNARSLSDFLKSTKKRYLDGSERSHFVLGNPAGDADSIISAITLAYLLDGPGDRVIPIISVPERQVKTQRPETTFLLKKSGINPSNDLLCIDQLSKEDFDDDRFTVSLVDHNRLDSSSLNLKWTVTEIVDHHFDEGQHTDSCSDTQRDVAFSENDGPLVASACTLVAERYISVFSGTSDIPAPLSMLLLGVILIDSVNMSPDAGKGTKRDRVAIDRLISQTDWSSISQLGDDAIWTVVEDRVVPDTDKLFDVLQSQKFNPDFWKGLSAEDALILDYKSFSIEENTESDPPRSFGISSVLVTLDDFFDKPNAIDEILSFMESQGISILAIMSAVSSTDGGGLDRQISVVGTNAEEWNKMMDYLTKSDPIQLSKLRSPTMNKSINISYMSQGNAKASRKLVAPIMMDFWKKTSGA